MFKWIKRRIAMRRFRKQIICCIKNKPKGIHLHSASYYYTSTTEKEKLISYVERILRHRRVKYTRPDETLFKLDNKNSVHLFYIEVI